MCTIEGITEDKEKVVQNKDTENDKHYANFYIIKRLEAVEVDI